MINLAGSSTASQCCSSAYRSYSNCKQLMKGELISFNTRDMRNVRVRLPEIEVLICGGDDDEAILRNSVLTFLGKLVDGCSG